MIISITDRDDADEGGEDHGHGDDVGDVETTP